MVFWSTRIAIPCNACPDVLGDLTFMTQIQTHPHAHICTKTHTHRAWVTTEGESFNRGIRCEEAEEESISRLGGEVVMKGKVAIVNTVHRSDI